MRHLAALAAAALLVSACGTYSPDDRRLVLVHAHAPTWTQPDSTLLHLMERVCTGDAPDHPPGVSDHDYGYLFTVALRACAKVKPHA